jgi:ATP-dependent Lon protease
VPIDASQVIWITTANDERAIPEPIRNRMNVFEIAPPSPDAARKIAAHLYRGILGEHDWGQRFDPEPADDVLDQLSGLAPREMRRALVTAFGNARLDNRYSMEADDLPRQGAGKSRIGFLQ